MKKRIETSVRIFANRETVWQILTDFEKYPEWNTFIKSVSGDVAVGNRIIIKLPGMSFKPIVLKVDENTELKWLGHFLFRGLFDGEHKFCLTDNGDGTTNFEQSESFSGILVKLFSNSLDKETTQGFEEMNWKLKSRAENHQVQFAV